jgi:hypothetical protein
MRQTWGVVSAISILAVGFAVGISVGQDKKSDPKVYELRTYTTLPGRLPARSTSASRITR